MIKKKKSLDKIAKTWYYEVGICIMKYTNCHKTSPKETREKWAVFLRVLVCDVIKFGDHHERMRINDPLASFTRASGRRIVCSSCPSYI